MKIISAQKKDMALLQEFLEPYEGKCVQLMSYVRKESEHLFILCDDSFPEDRTGSVNQIKGVLFVDKSVHHCLPFFKENNDLYRQPLKIIFKDRQIKCINGERSVTDFLLSILSTEEGIQANQCNYYTLMTLEDEPIAPPEELSLDDELKRCSEYDFEAIFDLQKKYIIKEVAPVSRQVTDLECTAGLHQILKNQLVFAVFSDGEPVSKANTNAIGVNWVQIGGVYTHPLFRRNYYAWHLVYTISQRAFRTGKKVCLFVKEKNNPARELYKKIGFQENCSYEIAYL